MTHLEKNNMLPCPLAFTCLWPMESPRRKGEERGQSASSLGTVHASSPRAVSITSPISPAPVKMILPWGSHSTLGCSLLFLMLLLLLLLSCFSRVRLCATPWTAAYQVPPSLGFSRQEHWSGVPFSSPMRESAVTQSCLTLSNRMDCSLAGFSVHGIFQARILEWVAIAFSGS